MEAAPKTTAIIYDSFLMKHKCRRKHPQKPQRVQAIIKELQANKYLSHPIVEFIDEIKRKATDDELKLAHPPKYIKHIQNLWPKTSHRTDMTILDSYFNQFTEEISRTAVGGLLDTTDRLMDKESSWENAFAVIRPPGHHSGARNTINGFCVYNNVAVAARYLIQKHKLKKVLVLDWDVHHGDGTQHIFREEPNVVFISTHRYDRATFYPASEEGDFKNSGYGVSKGMHVNVPLNYVNEKFKEYSFQAPGDNEYIYIYHRIIEPIIRSYEPEFIIISSGFDAARNDPLGGFTVTPNGYYYMTRKLKEDAIRLGMKNRPTHDKVKPVPLMLVLEGGYNLTSTSEASLAVVKALVDEQQFPEPEQIAQSITFNQMRYSCSIQEKYHQQLDEIIDHHSDNWPALKTEELQKFTELIKKNSTKRFGKLENGESSSSSLSDNVDEFQNQDRPNMRTTRAKSQQEKEKRKQAKQEQKLQKSKDKKEMPPKKSSSHEHLPIPVKQKKKSKVIEQINKETEAEESKYPPMTQFYFAAGHVQRFKNFSLDNPKLYKWAYDNEIKFYESKHISERQFAPQYHGKKGSYVEIENLLYNQKDPIIIDIKLSRISKNEQFDKEKREKEKKKELKSTSDKYSFRISGYTTPQFKEGGILINNEETVRKILKKVVSPENRSQFIEFLTRMSEKMKTVHRRYFGTSIILIKGVQKSIIRWVDFHHWNDEAEDYDHDLVEGIDNLIIFINSLTYEQQSSQ